MCVHFACLLSTAVALNGEVTVGDLLVGVGTLFLAAFTATLAKQTSHAVKVSEKGLALSRESIKALDRPFVIATPDANHSLLGFAEVGAEHPGWRFVYRFWNLGKGPAIVDDMSMVETTSQREFLTADELMERAVAMNPPVYDGLSRLEKGAPPGANAEMTLRIWYRSSAGARYVSISRVKVTGNLSCICTDFRQELATSSRSLSPVTPGSPALAPGPNPPMSACWERNGARRRGAFLQQGRQVDDDGG